MVRENSTHNFSLLTFVDISFINQHISILTNTSYKLEKMYALQVLDSNSVSHLNIDFTSSFLVFWCTSTVFWCMSTIFIMFISILYTSLILASYILKLYYLMQKKLLLFYFPYSINPVICALFCFQYFYYDTHWSSSIVFILPGCTTFLESVVWFFYLLGSSLRHFVINSLFLNDYLSTFLLLLLLHICYTFKLHFICILNFFL